FQTQNGTAGHTLAAPALTHDAERMPAHDLKADTVYGAYRTLLQKEIGLEVFDFQQRVVGAVGPKPVAGSGFGTVFNPGFDHVNLSIRMHRDRRHRAAHRPRN